MTLITLTDPRSPISEAYRTLRTNLSFYSLDRPIRTLVVTSPAPEEGKSTTCHRSSEHHTIRRYRPRRRHAGH